MSIGWVHRLVARGNGICADRRIPISTGFGGKRSHRSCFQVGTVLGLSARPSVCSAAMELYRRIRRRSSGGFSRTAFGEPGRLTISVPDRIPQTPREIMAIGVFLKVSMRIASARPGASRSITRRVASGVLSRGAKPVPPVVMIRFTSGRSASLRRASGRKI